MPPVQDQGATSHCWIHAALTDIEVQQALANNAQQPLLLSVQQVVDGLKCGQHLGGQSTAAWSYIKDVGGILTDDAYHGHDGQCDTSSASKPKVAARVTGCVSISNDETLMKIAAQEHCLSVCIKATTNFLQYTGGVLNEPDWDKDGANTNHAVVIVGFGRDSVHQKDFWLIRNTWGETWGENGYARILRGANMLGIARCNAFFPVIEECVSHFEFWISTNPHCHYATILFFLYFQC